MHTLTTPNNVFLTEDLPTGEFIVRELTPGSKAIKVPYEAINKLQSYWRSNPPRGENKHTVVTERVVFNTDGVTVSAYRRSKQKVVVTMNLKELLDLYDQYARAWKTYQASSKTTTTKPVTPQA